MRRGDRAAAQDYLTDALTVLTGWQQDGCEIERLLPLDEAQHAALTERVKVVADALQLRPTIRRLGEQTLIRVGCADGPLTDCDITLAARIEDAYRVVTGTG